MPIPKEELRTRYASEARALSEEFAASSLASTRVGDRRPELLAPDVLSTAGGVQATLHLRLVPPTGPALVVGHANPKDGSAELRTFDHADRLHRERFGGSMAVARDAYDKFLDAAEMFFLEHGLKVVRAGPPSVPPPSVPPPAARKLAPVLVLVVTVVVLVALFLWLKR